MGDRARARRRGAAAEREPLVLANTENGVRRPAEREPAQTLCASRGLAVVLANRANNVPRRADSEPAAPVLTGGQLAVVELQANGDTQSAGEPAHTVRAGGQHHGLLVLRNTSASSTAGSTSSCAAGGGAASRTGC